MFECPRRALPNLLSPSRCSYTAGAEPHRGALRAGDYGYRDGHGGDLGPMRLEEAASRWRCRRHTAWASPCARSIRSISLVPRDYRHRSSRLGAPSPTNRRPFRRTARCHSPRTDRPSSLGSPCGLSGEAASELRHELAYLVNHVLVAEGVDFADRDRVAETSRRARHRGDRSAPRVAVPFRDGREAIRLLQRHLSSTCSALPGRSCSNCANRRSERWKCSASDRRRRDGVYRTPYREEGWLGFSA